LIILPIILTYVAFIFNFLYYIQSSSFNQQEENTQYTKKNCILNEMSVEIIAMKITKQPQETPQETKSRLLLHWMVIDRC